MTSIRKIEANRLNARLSTGPRTAAGRARTRRNALKSGLYARTVLLPGEDASAYEKLRVSVYGRYMPEDAIEEGLVELVVADLWRLQRLTRIENHYLENSRVRNSQRRRMRKSKKTLEVFLADIRGGKMVPPPYLNEEGDSSYAPPPRIPDFGNPYDNRKADEVAADEVLLDAFVIPVSPSSMDDIARQRRSVTRDLQRNIAALEAMVGSRGVLAGRFL